MTTNSLHVVSFDVLESVKNDLNNKYKPTCKSFDYAKLINFFSLTNI